MATTITYQCTYFSAYLNAAACRCLQLYTTTYPYRSNGNQRIVIVAVVLAVVVIVFVVAAVVIVPIVIVTMSTSSTIRRGA